MIREVEKVGIGVFILFGGAPIDRTVPTGVFCSVTSPERRQPRNTIMCISLALPWGSGVKDIHSSVFFLSSEMVAKVVQVGRVMQRSKIRFTICFNSIVIQQTIFGNAGLCETGV